jgi:biopolymer transport protein ExbD
MAGGGGGDSIYEDEPEGGGMISDINVTPLVDITLVLLIIFMVTAHLIEKHAIPGVETPKAATGEEVRTTLQITIDKDRNLFFNGDKVANTEAMRDGLKAAVAQNPDVQCVITADTTVPYGDFVGVVDEVHLAGVKNTALTVTEKAKPPSNP